MVKRSRSQSQEAPRRFSWSMIWPPDSAFHCQTRSMKASRPRSWRSLPFGGQLALHHVLGGDAGIATQNVVERAAGQRGHLAP